MSARIAATVRPLEPWHVVNDGTVCRQRDDQHGGERAVCSEHAFSQQARDKHADQSQVAVDSRCPATLSSRTGTRRVPLRTPVGLTPFGGHLHWVPRDQFGALTVLNDPLTPDQSIGNDDTDSPPEPF
jgi:hypothetical protein